MGNSYGTGQKGCHTKMAHSGKKSDIPLSACGKNLGHYHHRRAVFRAESFMKGLYMFKNIFRNFEIGRLWDGTLLTLGLDKADYLVLAAGCMVVAIVGSMKERNLLGDECVQRFYLPVRWAIYYGLFFSVIIFGAYGTGYQQVEMIYAGF